MIRVITVSREYGSGGGAIGRLLAARLNWKLLDASLIEEIAKAAKVDPALAERYDEVTDPWFRYNLMICSSMGLETACNAILCAAGLLKDALQSEAILNA